MGKSNQLLRLLSLFLLLFTSSLVQAAWIIDGTPICTANYDQQSPRITADGEGGAIVVWTDGRAHPSYRDIYANKADAAGTVLWGTDGIGVSVLVMVTRVNPQLIPTGDGGAFIVWQDYRNGNYDIYAQRVYATGYGQWTANGHPICTAVDIQGSPQLVSDGAGGVIITWSDRRNNSTMSNDIYAQRVNANGVAQWTANGIAVAAFTSAQQTPQIASDGAGGAIITWEDYRSGEYLVYAQRVGPSGTLLWAAGGVAATTSTSRQRYQQIVADGDGGAIISWVDYRVSPSDIYAQRLNASGVRQWAAGGVAVCSATGGQMGVQMDEDGAGGAVLAWEDDRRGSTTNSDVYVQRISNTGVVYWTAQGVAACTLTAGGTASCDVVSDGAGGAIVTWVDIRNDSGDIYAQKVGAAGTPAWAAGGVAVCQAPSSQLTPKIASDGANGAMITWYESRVEPNDIYLQRVYRDGYCGDPRPEVIATNPVRNALNIPVNRSVSATFNMAMDDMTIINRSFRIHGNLTGYHTGPVTQYLNRFTTNPSTDFAPGELVTVSLTDQIEASTGIPLLAYSWSFAVAAGEAEASFALDGQYATGASPRSMYAADLDGDHDIDLVTLNIVGDNISVFLNNGNGTFAPHVTYPTGDGPSTISAADFNWDGSVDLAVTVGDIDAVAIHLNNGNGTFAARTEYPVGNHPYTVLEADMDGDGDLDLVTGNLTDVSVVLNQGNGTFAAPNNYPSGQYCSSVVAIDVDGDGDLDVATANVNHDTVTLLSNDGAGNLGIVQVCPVTGRPEWITAADLDGDGDFDLATPNRDANTVAVLMNNGHGTFAGQVTYPTDDDPCKIFAADLDGDGDQDLATANLVSQTVTVLLNNGNGTFASGGNVTTGYNNYCLFSADFDGDEDLDLAVAHVSNHLVSILLNQGASPVLDGDEVLPPVSRLFQNSPNPFNPVTQIEYELDQDGQVELAVFDVLGRRITTLVRERQSRGARVVTWNGQDEAGSQMASGVYFYKLVAGDFVQMRKMVLLK